MRKSPDSPWEGHFSVDKSGRAQSKTNCYCLTFGLTGPEKSLGVPQRKYMLVSEVSMKRRSKNLTSNVRLVEIETVFFGDLRSFLLVSPSASGRIFIGVTSVASLFFFLPFFWVGSPEPEFPSYGLF